MNIQAAVDAAFQAVSVRLAHVTAPARRALVVLALRKRRQPKGGKAPLLWRSPVQSDHLVPTMRAMCLLLARGRKCRRML